MLRQIKKNGQQLMQIQSNENLTQKEYKMTNVKLKLMFFLLNSLLTADIVHARPYSNMNTSDLVIKYSNANNTFIPVESNSDTLIVASDEQTAGEINKSSKSHMEAIVDAEQNRDEDLSEKVMKEFKKIPATNDSLNTQIEAIVNAEQGRDEDLSEKVKLNYGDPNTLTIYNDETSGSERQLNISSPLLDKIIDAETDREDTLTDIQLRPDLIDMPRFEFLIAGKINESDITNTSKDGVVGGNSLERNNSDVLRKVDYVELVEVVRPSKMSENKSAYSIANITGHEVDNDLAPDTRFSDVQTLFLACFGTLLPLLAVLFATLLIRSMCRRWCKKTPPCSESDSSEKQDTNHQLKSPSDGGDGIENGDQPANGSIFTMTLKNNHLIVETEERNDITKNGRETKMKYSPDNDGIFVVEVQQSQAYRPNNSKSHQISPPHDPQISTNQALIHRVPEDLERKAVEDESERSSTQFDKEKALALSSTGLSISDLSMSSAGSHNVSYSYGSQMGYEQGPFGYPLYAGYDISKEEFSDGIVHDNSQEPLISKTPTDPDKPVVTAAIFKQDSIIGNDALQGPGYCIEGSTDGPLLSDVQAREYSLQHLHDQREKKLENGVAVPISERIESPKKTLCRADSLPVRLENDAPPVIEKQNIAMDTINENDSKDIQPPSKEMLKGKRASLPIIRTEVYESVRDVIRPTGSPKFERFKNDISPGEGAFDPPPLITITEESESSKADSTS